MSTISKERRDAIRAAAEKATPGRWQIEEIENRDDRGKFTSFGVAAYPSWSPDRPKSVVDTINSGVMEILTEYDEDGSTSWDAQGKRDCTHIANCDPQTILALLDALDAAEAREVVVKPLEWRDIGMVREDGAIYYAEAAECDRSRASQWVVDNVFPHLDHSMVKPRARIAADIVAFAGGSPQFWAYYADYDWVALCQLFGTMMDLPKGWPMYCRDVKQLCDESGNPTLPKQATNEPNALDDARWTKDAWEFLRRPSGSTAG